MTGQPGVSSISLEAPRAPLGMFFRWSVAALGAGALVVALVLFPIAFSANLALLVVLAVLADLSMQIQLRDGRAVSLASAFTFILFLQYGPEAAALGHAAGLLARSGVKRLRTGRADTTTFTAFNIGQLSLSSLLAGSLALWASGSARAPAANPGLTLLIYAVLFLVANIAFTTVAVWLSHGPEHVRAVLWPRTSLWTGISFAFTAPLALATLGVAQLVPFPIASLLVFFAAAGIHSIAQLNLELAQRNEQLARANLDLRAINDATRSLAAVTDPEALWPAFYEQISRLARTDTFRFARVSGAGHQVEWVVDRGKARPGQAAERCPITEKVMRTGKTVVARGHDEIAALGLDQGLSNQVAAGAVAGLPLVSGGQLVGAFVLSSDSPLAYGENQLAMLETLAHNSAVLLTNATLVARLRSALRDREEYLSVVSHELKNPIAAIQAYTQLAVRRSDSADDRLQQTLDRIDLQTQRLRRLVDDLLSLSRIDTGHFELEREPTDLSALAAQAVESARASFSDYRFTLQAAAEPVTATVDPARLLQVLDNLIHNAVKYSSPGDEVRVELRRDDRGAEIAVRDQGIGIAPEDRQRIFSRFYRVPGAEERATGLGIGLSVVAELVRAHGGHVDVRSTPGQGSEFVVVLPT